MCGPRLEAQSVFGLEEFKEWFVVAYEKSLVVEKLEMQSRKFGLTDGNEPADCESHIFVGVAIDTARDGATGSTHGAKRAVGLLRFVRELKEAIVPKLRIAEAGERFVVNKRFHDSTCDNTETEEGAELRCR